MNMTNYMQLLADNQPWNLILFMAVPVVLAETVAICEIWGLAAALPESSGFAKARRAATVMAAVWMAGVVAWLVPNAVMPLTSTDGWRGAFDVVAVGCYLLGAVPMWLMALPGAAGDEPEKKKRRAILLGTFLVLAHVAMVFGLADPTLSGWSAEAVAGAGSHAGHMSDH